MKDINTINTQEYLQTVVSLENSIYQVNSEYDAARNSLEQNRPTYSEDTYSRNTFTDYSLTIPFMIFTYLPLAMAGIVFLLGMYAVVFEKEGSSFYTTIFNVMPILMPIGFGVPVITIIVCSIMMSIHNSRVSISDNKRYEQYQENLEKHRKLSKRIGKLLDPLDDLEHSLKKIYNLDIIYPKYRNLVAMSTILEYFESGRVTELTGPNGAYNLYESELRQNIIIANLDSIRNNLEVIKNNQYFIYQQLVEVNATIDKLNRNITRGLNEMYQQGKELKELAINQQMIKMNTERLAASTAAMQWYAANTK